MIRRSFHEMSGWLRAGSCWPEREFTRQWDALNAERRKLPMTEIGKEYAFEGRYGKASLLVLFEGRGQLLLARSHCPRPPRRLGAATRTQRQPIDGLASPSRAASALRMSRREMLGERQVAAPLMARGAAHGALRLAHRRFQPGEGVGIQLAGLRLSGKPQRPSQGQFGHETLALAFALFAPAASRPGQHCAVRRQRGRQAAPCGHASTVGQRFLRLVPRDDEQERRSRTSMPGTGWTNPSAAGRRYARKLSVHRGPSPLQFRSIAHPGACGKTRVVPHNRRPGRKLRNGGREVRVLLSTCRSRPTGAVHHAAWPPYRTAWRT